MQKQKNNQNILIYYKWALSLLNIRYNLEKANIFPLPILTYNNSTTFGTIDIIQELTD